MMHKAWSSAEKGALSSSIKFQGHTGQKIANFCPNSAFQESNSSFEFTGGFEIMDKAWHSVEEVPYGFWYSSIKFQGNMGLKNKRLQSNWSKIIRPVTAIKSLRFALFPEVSLPMQLNQARKISNHYN